MTVLNKLGAAISRITPTINTKTRHFEKLAVEATFACARCGREHDPDVPCGTNKDCELCHGSGWLHPLREDGRLDGSKAVACSGKDCHAAFSGERLPMIDRFGVSRMQTFDNFIPGAGNEEALQASISLAEGKSDFIFLTIFGSTGNGKTHLANAVARRLQQEGQVVRRLTMQEMLDFIQDGIPDNTISGRIRELETVSFLVIDEVKIAYLKEAKSAWFLEKFEQIVGYRYDARLPTMLTTNEKPEQMPPRLRSRLSDKRIARMIWNKAPDYRGNENNMHKALIK